MGPREADAPLLLDTDAVLTPSITFQLLKAVARRHLQIAEAFGVVDHLEFAQGRLDDPRVKLLALPSPPHFSSGAALKGLDHTPLYYRVTSLPPSTVGIVAQQGPT